jgi:hypothetical protein
LGAKMTVDVASPSANPSLLRWRICRSFPGREAVRLSGASTGSYSHYSMLVANEEEAGNLLTLPCVRIGLAMRKLRSLHNEPLLRV